eukprot:CAMPEP_0206480092 /NCGR_PEP_ID=MMETSP0324_2-20121206/37049_1 /ASSEMBLY_ACC=CAM_ASM_000836 /TAXON_ID=2866 /ORGANISM="Crypthecodinium cohnii, Strain Seligo" /LENGTH=359 /DNA_ID=CAMNT_0053956735 /DNA_START=21 /DNA_END=1097 /DNA_ORIENTATION=-
MTARLPDDAPVPGLLRCLGCSMFIASFEEEGYNTLKDLRADEEEVVKEFISALGMPNRTDERLLEWAFERKGEGGSKSSKGAAGGGAKTSEEEEDGDEEEEDEAEDEVRDQKIPSCGVFDPAWLAAVAPLYSRHMGCENMGPLLYSLARFVKPQSCLEIGAGYTSAFLLQALEDNAKELKAWEQWQRESGIEDWLVEGIEKSASSSGGLLHCVDNLAHEGTTANRLLAVAHRLGLESRLALHLDDARAFLDEYTGECIFDFVWLDGFLDFAFAGGGLKGRGGGGGGSSAGGTVVDGLEAFMEDMWPRIAPGGFVLMHSTLTNSTTRAWIQDLASRDSKWGPPGALLSLMEPHKRFQNAV